MKMSQLHSLWGGGTGTTTAEQTEKEKKTNIGNIKRTLLIYNSAFGKGGSSAAFVWLIMTCIIKIHKSSVAPGVRDLLKLK